jgi:hypothetical protein
MWVEEFLVWAQGDWTKRKNDKKVETASGLKKLNEVEKLKQIPPDRSASAQSGSAPSPSDKA